MPTKAFLHLPVCGGPRLISFDCTSNTCGNPPKPPNNTLWISGLEKKLAVALQTLRQQHSFNIDTIDRYWPKSSISEIHPWVSNLSLINPNLFLELNKVLIASTLQNIFASRNLLLPWTIFWNLKAFFQIAKSEFLPVSVNALTKWSSPRQWQVCSISNFLPTICKISYQSSYKGWGLLKVLWKPFKGSRPIGVSC